MSRAQASLPTRPSDVEPAAAEPAAPAPAPAPAATTALVSSRHHHRTHSGPSKKKTLRPVVSRRESSKTVVPQTQTVVKQKTKPAADSSQVQQDDSFASDSLAYDHYYDDMAPTFLQYCATCEKQMVAASAPGGLYCSDDCKSKDAAVTTGYPLFRHDYAIPSSTARRSRNASVESLDPDVVPQRSPTQPSAAFAHRPSTASSRNSSVSASPTHSADRSPERYLLGRDASSSASLLNLSRSGTPRSRPRSDRSNSEAGHYLQQFHSLQHGSSLPRRSSLANAVPSLSHTPSSSRAPSIPSSSPPHSTTLANRPAARAHHSFSTRTIDLVTPVTAEEQAEFDASTMGSVASDDTIRPGDDGAAPIKAGQPLPLQGFAYEKQSMPRSFAGSSSLKQLLEARK